MNHVYIVTGYNRVGKTTLAHILEETITQQGLGRFKTFPFGEELKKELVRAGFTRPYLDAKSEKARRLMRAYGDAVRESVANHFVDLWKKSVEEWLSKADPKENQFIAADDVYHHIELSAMLDLAEKHHARTTIICVARDGFFPTQEEITNYDSVKESSQIFDMIESGFQKDNINKIYNDKILQQIKNSHILTIHNNYENIVGYKVHLQQSVVPTIL